MPMNVFIQQASYDVPGNRHYNRCLTYCLYSRELKRQTTEMGNAIEFHADATLSA